MKERYLLEDGGDNSFSLITDYDGNDEQAFDVNVKSGEILPVLPLRNMVLFPGVFLPITVGRKSSLKLVRDADKKHKDIAVVCQRSAHTEDPKLEDLHNIGTVGRIVRILEMPDQTTTVILQGMKRLSLTSIIETHPYLKGEIELLEEDVPGKDDKEFQALVETCKDLTMRYIKSSDVMHQDSSFAIKNINNSMFLVNFICSNLPFKKDEKMDLLSINSLRERTYHLLEILNREVQLAEIKASIQMRAREDIDQQQREYFLQQQIKTIQDELGVQRVRSTSDIIQAGEVCSGRVADSGVHNRNLIFGAGIGHTLSCQGGNGHHRIISIGNHLGADLVQRGSVVLAVKIFVLNGNALFGGFGVQLCFHSGADLIQAGVVQLLDHRNFVRLGGIICGSSFAAGGCSGIGAGGSGRSGGGGGTTGGEGGEHSGGGQNSNKLFHGKSSFLSFTFKVYRRFVPGSAGAGNQFARRHRSRMVVMLCFFMVLLLFVVCAGYNKKPLHRNSFLCKGRSIK